MEYIPGEIHESLQRIRHFLIEGDFAWINCCDKRYEDFSSTDDWERFTDTIELKTGDIISLRFFKSGQQCNCYLDSVESESIITNYKTESLMSRGFIDLNNTIFKDITKMIIRDRMINKILNEEL